MPKFNEGDIVVPVKVKFHLNTATHRNYSYNAEMHRLMVEGRAIKVYYAGEDCVLAGNYNWHPNDLALFNISLENK